MPKTLTPKGVKISKGLRDNQLKIAEAIERSVIKDPYGKPEECVF
jgi:hypothetical protein